MVNSKKGDVSAEFVRRVTSSLPAFTDIFDEETFYIFFACLTIIVAVGAFLFVRFFDIEINDAGFAETRAMRSARQAREASRRSKHTTYSG
ncbi:hypothetical protein Ciccas_009540 [Cichlidogyrus casuarinus]|uniref:Uncharacterized protein n=1 Tax=Cichlidogyrus casuarinus TaxID=1844966 RepID=A0ABD2PY58_9PLAT